MPARTQRLVLVLAAKDHKLIARAARVQGVTISAFASSVLVEEAQEVVDEDADQRRGLAVWKILASMAAKEKPNSPLRRAVRAAIADPWTEEDDDEPVSTARRSRAKKRGQSR